MNKTKQAELPQIETSVGPPQGAAEDSKSTPIERVEKWLSRSYDFRYNIITGRIEYKPKGDKGSYEQLDERETNSFYRGLKKKGIKISITGLRSILYSDFSEIYNPFEEYFYSLPVWDGKTDYIAELAATVKTTNDELWQKCFKKWIIAAVGCALDENIINHTVIVFSGKQGIGKTTWMLNLVPEELQDYCFSGTVKPDNKDTLLHLSECFLILMDELENLNRTAIGSLKELITKNAIRVRRAYGYYNESWTRRASFAGSVNNKEFLTDSTGSRRFLCFEVSNIDYAHTVDIRNVYAQALHLFQSGFRFWFNAEETKEITASNEQYDIMTVEEESLLTWFEPAPESEANLFLTPTAIATLLAEKTTLSVNNSVKQRLGHALRKHCFVRLKRSNRWVYALREKDAEIVGYQTKYSTEEDKRE